MQLAMCLFCAIANYVWLQQEGKQHYYLALDSYVQGNWENPAAQLCLTFLTFWILLSYLVPISLFVTLEIVKFWQVGGRVGRSRWVRLGGGLRGAWWVSRGSIVQFVRQAHPQLMPSPAVSAAPSNTSCRGLCL